MVHPGCASPLSALSHSTRVYRSSRSVLLYVCTLSHPVVNALSILPNWTIISL